MIKGTGIDLVEIRRIRRIMERHGQKFASKILTDNEIEQLPKGDSAPRLAALFAGKEAAVKALGTGFSRGIHFKCIEILHAKSGKPSIHFSGKAQEAALSMEIRNGHISLTHEKGHAAAVVILED